MACAPCRRSSKRRWRGSTAGACRAHGAGADRRRRARRRPGRALRPAAGRDAARVRRRAAGLLPWDAKLLEVQIAGPEFHSRRDALWKEYVYRWSRAEVIAPRDALFVAAILAARRLERLREAARGSCGERDFRVFAVNRAEASPGCGTSTPSPSARTARDPGRLPRRRLPARDGALDLRRAGRRGPRQGPVERMAELLETGAPPPAAPPFLQAEAPRYY